MRDSVPILLVEDNVGDVTLAREAFLEAGVPNPFHVVRDGVEALRFLRREGPFADAPRPGLVLLDLSLPRLDGRELLHEIKRDGDLRRIPVVVLTSSCADGDVRRSYDLHANAYVAKPLEYEGLVQAARAIGRFWLELAQLPRP